MKAIQRFKQKLSDNKVWKDTLSFNRWDYIKKADTADTNLYFVENGSIRVYFSEDAYEHSLYFGFDGSLITALDSFFTEKPSSTIIQCINKTSVKVIPKEVLNDLIHGDEKLSFLWQEVLSELSLWHHEREKDLLINSPLARYERIVSRQPFLLQKVPHKYIASYLRMTPETLSRLLNS